MRHILHRSLAVLLLILLRTVATGSLLDIFDSGGRNVASRCEDVGPERSNDLSLVNNYPTLSPESSIPIVQEQQTTSLAPITRRNPHTTAPGDLFEAALQRRGRETLGGLAYRYLEVYIIQPATEGLSALSADLDAAYESYQQALKAIKADHPPLFQLRLTYGRLQLSFTATNPLNVEAVQDAIGLFLFAAKIGWAAYFRIALWSLKATLFFAAFTILPQMSGGHNLIS